MFSRSSGAENETVIGARVPQPLTPSSSARVRFSHWVGATSIDALILRWVGELLSNRVAKSLGSGISGNGLLKTSKFTCGPDPGSASARPWGGAEHAANKQ